MEMWKFEDYHKIIRYNIVRGLSLNQCIDETRKTLDPCRNQESVRDLFVLVKNKIDEEGTSMDSHQSRTINEAVEETEMLARVLNENKRITYLLRDRETSSDKRT